MHASHIQNFKFSSSHISKSKKKKGEIHFNFLNFNNVKNIVISLQGNSYISSAQQLHINITAPEPYVC